MQIGLSFEAFGNDLGLEGNRGKDLRVGVKGDSCPAPANLTNLLERAGRVTPNEALFPFCSVAFDLRDQMIGERGDDRGADAVQTPRMRVVEPFKFPPGMERSENQFECRFFELRMNINWDTTTVVAHSDG